MIRSHRRCEPKCHFARDEEHPVSLCGIEHPHRLTDNRMHVDCWRCIASLRKKRPTGWCVSLD